MYNIVCIQIILSVTLRLSSNVCFSNHKINFVQTAQIGHVACSLLTTMKFGLDESTRREPKVCCLLVWWLVYATNNSYHLVAGWVIMDFYSSGE